MNENKPFEHEIDPDLLAEIEEWEKADHDEPAEYYFSNPRSEEHTSELQSR